MGAGKPQLSMLAETLSSPVLFTPHGCGGAGCAAHRLDVAQRGRSYTVRHVVADPQVPERARQLEEIGFFSGEEVMVMSRGFPGGDPLVVRVGQSTFALRGAEAACVHIDADSAAGA